MNTTSLQPVIRCQTLYKIFGITSDQLQKDSQGLINPSYRDRQGVVTAVDNVSLDVSDGELLVVMGLSGSGKSTLVRCLSRLIEPTSGSIEIEGNDVLAMSEKELIELRRNKMGMVFQNFALLPHKTVLENIAFPLQMRGMKRAEFVERAMKMIALVGLDEKENSFPRELSGGQQQRVGIARALVSDAPIMLMDEAFSALDPLIRSDMQDLLLELQEELQKTIVFITHDLDEALKLADHLVILKDGEVVQQGDPQEILLNPGDPYIVDFISDINRARVLRVRSVMERTQTPPETAAGEIQGCQAR